MSSTQQNFRPKPPTNQIQAVDFSERIKRYIRAYDKEGLEYIPDKQKDVFELDTIRYKKQYPNDVYTNIGYVYRVLLPKAGMFEFENGEIDTEGKVKEALVYSKSEYVDNVAMINKVGYSVVEGVYEYPIVRFRSRDQMGNLSDPYIPSKRNIFYIKYSREKLEEILRSVNNMPKSFGVAVAVEFTPNRFVKSFGVPNYEEFIEGHSILELIDANEKGFLTKEYGGFLEYQESKENAKKAGKVFKPKGKT